MSFTEYLIFVVVIQQENLGENEIVGHRCERNLCKISSSLFPSSSDDIQVVYKSKNYFVVNKDDLVPIDAYEAPSQINVTQ